MGKSLYRSYRSKSFDEIIGQDHITTVLKNSLKNDSISHAYLLSGPRGVGKTSTARILAHAVNEINYEGENINLDIIEIDAASNRRIDEVREIRERVHIAPVAGKYKVYIIDEVHMLTKEAFNALLKTLEEPPSHAIFILATTEIHKIPETILSRCIKLNFKPISNNLLTNHLNEIAKKEKIDITPGAIDIIARHGRGSFRDAISLLEQVKFISEKIDVDEVNVMLGLVSEAIIDTILEDIVAKNLLKMRQSLESAYEYGANESILATQLSGRFRNLLGNPPESFSQSQLLTTLHKLLQVSGSTNPRIELELCLTSLIIDNQITAQNIKPIPGNSIAVKHETKQPETEIKATKPSKDVKDQPVTTSKKLSTENSDIWTRFLSDLKKKNNTLYGIARMAKVSFGDDQIELGFKFAFHYKQVNDPKNQQIFSEILQKISQDPPKIILTLEGTTDKPKSDSLKNLSNIFGGHEVLES